LADAFRIFGNATHFLPEFWWLAVVTVSEVLKLQALDKGLSKFFPSFLLEKKTSK